MDSGISYTIPIAEAHEFPVNMVGGKTRNSSLCSREGFRIPEGFAIKTDTYFEFIQDNNIDKTIGMELARKDTSEMRWEEVWDSALRIRLAFTRGVMNPKMEASILKSLTQWPKQTKFAIRSSSPEEDSKEFSFAGVHESYVNIAGDKEILEKIKLVWASLWSDRALLYKKESGLDPAKSSMAVLVQKMEHRDVSGLTFTADPSNKDDNHMVAEAIRGSLNLLVDNKKTPERIRINKNTGDYTEVGKPLSGKTFTKDSIQHLYNNSLRLEKFFKEPVDIEWTGLIDDFTVLQVRPITVFKKDENQERQWYLTLTPSGEKLLDLAEKVEKTLIPELIEEGQQLSILGPKKLARDVFLQELKKRGESHDKWEKIYRDEFIPFAHGIRHFGSFYNDLMKPSDPYAFIHLLKNQDMLAQKRDRIMSFLGDYLQARPAIKQTLIQWIKDGFEGQALLEKFEEVSEMETENKEFAIKFLEFLNNEMDVSYDHVNLKEAPEATLRVILELANNERQEENQQLNIISKTMTKDFFQKATKESVLEEAENWLRIGRVSWKLRDDDNLLLGKIESHLQDFILEGLRKLYQENKIDKIPRKFDIKGWKSVYQGLFQGISIELPEDEEKTEEIGIGNVKARQLVG